MIGRNVLPEKMASETINEKLSGQACPRPLDCLVGL